MNEDNRKKVWKLIQKQGDLIKKKLRPHPHHPKGRNPYAHVCGTIKSHYGLSYKDIQDEKIYELQNFIRNVKN